MQDKRLGSINQIKTNAAKAQEFYELAVKLETEVEELKSQQNLVKNAKESLELKLKQEQEKNAQLHTQTEQGFEFTSVT